MGKEECARWSAVSEERSADEGDGSADSMGHRCVGGGSSECDTSQEVVRCDRIGGERSAALVSALGVRGLIHWFVSLTPLPPPYPFFPIRKAPYTDPHSTLRYHNAEVYEVIKTFQPGVVQAYLGVRGMAAKLT